MGIPRPIAIEKYNLFMGGVDKSDQYLAYHNVRKTVHYWKTLFYHMIDVAVVLCQRMTSMMNWYFRLLISMENTLQWNPSITDTIGTQHFVRYSEVSLTQGLLVYFR